mgnify:CR=1 FL=1
MLTDAGYDPAFGARPLKRAIRRLLEDPLARMVAARGVHAIASLLPLIAFWLLVVRWRPLERPRAALLFFAASGLLVYAGTQPSGPTFAAGLSTAAVLLFLMVPAVTHLSRVLRPINELTQEAKGCIELLDTDQPCRVDETYELVYDIDRAREGLRQSRWVMRLLLRSGADIHAFNCVRKHLSRIKGGRLADAAYPATVVTLAIFASSRIAVSSRVLSAIA